MVCLNSASQSLFKGILQKIERLVHSLFIRVDPAHVRGELQVVLRRLIHVRRGLSASMVNRSKRRGVPTGPSAQGHAIINGCFRLTTFELSPVTYRRFVRTKVELLGSCVDVVVRGVDPFSLGVHEALRVDVLDFVGSVSTAFEQILNGKTASGVLGGGIQIQK